MVGYLTESVPHKSRLLRMLPSERQIEHKMVLILLVVICGVFRGTAGQLCIFKCHFNSFHPAFDFGFTATAENSVNILPALEGHQASFSLIEVDCTIFFKKFRSET